MAYSTTTGIEKEDLVVSKDYDNSETSYGSMFSNWNRERGSGRLKRLGRDSQILPLGACATSASLCAARSKTTSLNNL